MAACWAGVAVCFACASTGRERKGSRLTISWSSTSSPRFTSAEIALVDAPSCSTRCVTWRAPVERFEHLVNRALLGRAREGLVALQQRRDLHRDTGHALRAMHWLGDLHSRECRWEHRAEHDAQRGHVVVRNPSSYRQHSARQRLAPRPAPPESVWPQLLPSPHQARPPCQSCDARALARPRASLRSQRACSAWGTE